LCHIQHPVPVETANLRFRWQTADRGPPHPVDRQTPEGIFASVNGRGQQHREDAGDHTDQNTRQQPRHSDECGMRRHREEGTRPNDVMPCGRCRGAGQPNRNQAARLPFEQQQLNREENCGYRRCECGRHAAGREPFARVVVLWWPAKPHRPRDGSIQGCSRGSVRRRGGVLAGGDPWHGRQRAGAATSAFVVPATCLPGDRHRAPASSTCFSHVSSDEWIARPRNAARSSASSGSLRRPMS